MYYAPSVSARVKGSQSFPGWDGVYAQKAKTPQAKINGTPTGFLRKLSVMRKLRHTSTLVNYRICNITAALAIKGGAV